MITNALEITAFMAIIAWPLTLPMALALLTGLILLVVYCVKHWRNKKIWIGAGAVAVGVLLLVSLLVSAVKRESQPYSESAALRLYESHQTAYDTVAAFVQEQAETDESKNFYLYSLGSREDWPREIKRELNHVLNNWSLRSGNPNVWVRWLGIDYEDFVVLFKIYMGPGYDSGDGATAYDVQYLAYIPDGNDAKLYKRYGGTSVHLTGDWYLYTSTSW